MPLPALPTELLLLVASTLSTRVASLILADRHLHSLLTPTLTARARQDHRSLHHAAAHGHHDVLQHYLLLGVAPSIADSDSCTAPHVAVRCGDEVAVRILLDYGTAPDAGTKCFWGMPLLRAVKGRSVGPF